MNYVIFTDGASKGNPGPGGWGVVVASEDQIKELGGGERDTTNNRMELKAAIVGLSALDVSDASSIIVYADSKYVIDGITKWVYGWQKNGWKTSLGKPVLNDDLWKELVELVMKFGKKLHWKYVGGHVGIAGNERVDEIASSFSEGKPVPLYNGPATDYKIDVKNLSVDSALASTKSRSNGKAYSYVSEVDGEVKIHKTWAECEARVGGQKARYRKALNAGEEKEIVEKFSK